MFRSDCWPSPRDQLSKIHDNRQQQQQQRRRQYVEAPAAAAAAAAVAAERVVYRTTHAVPLAHARKLHTYASTHTQSKRSRLNIRTQQKQQQHNDYWQQYQTGPTAVAAARSSGAAPGAAKASYRPFDDSVSRWLRVDVRDRTRRAYARSKRKYQHCTQQKQQQHNGYS